MIFLEKDFWLKKVAIGNNHLGYFDILPTYVPVFYLNTSSYPFTPFGPINKYKF